MRIRKATIAAIAFAATTAALGAALNILKGAHGAHWAIWFVVVAAAIVAALAAIFRPLIDAISRAWARRAEIKISKEERAHEIEAQSGGLSLAGAICDRALLGIHPAIPLPSDADPSLSTDLPLYIPRDIDADLRTWVSAHKSTGGFLLLVGPPAAGKTRSVHQFTREALYDWPLFMPATAVQLDEYAATGTYPEKLVIWLNDIHDYLGIDGIPAATIRRLLASPQVVIILGTTWPDRYDALAAPASAGSARHSDTGPRNNARQILTILADRQDLSPNFTQAELSRAHHLANHDPRIAEALSHPDSTKIPETLAATPDLIARWLGSGNPTGAAMITAAVTARRCGHPEPLPSTILKPLAEAALTSYQRAQFTPGWFAEGLDWARQPVRGQASPLTAQARVPGQIDGDHVTDILIQHANTNLVAPWHDTPDAIWNLLIDHATAHGATEVGVAAIFQKRLIVADRALRKGVDGGIVWAMLYLAILRHVQGDVEEAEHWYRKAADAGDTEAMVVLGNAYSGVGNYQDAENWYRKAADAGDAEGMVGLASIFEAQGDDEQAVHWCRMLAEAGNIEGMISLGIALIDHGKPDEAEHWWRQAAAAGNPNGMFNLGVMFSERRNPDQAEYWWRQAAVAEHHDAMYNLGNTLREQHNDEEAELWLRKAAEAAQPYAMLNLAVLLSNQGRPEEAERWLRQAADTGDVSAVVELAKLHLQDGKEQEAMLGFRKAASEHHPDAMTFLGVMLRIRGDQNEAELWLRKAAEAQQPFAMYHLGCLLQDREQGQEAELWWRTAADNGETNAMMMLALKLYEPDNYEEAESWWRKAAERGDFDSMCCLAVMLHNKGNHGEAEQWWYRAAETSVTHTEAGLELDSAWKAFTKDESTRRIKLRQGVIRARKMAIKREFIRTFCLPIKGRRALGR